MQKNIKTLKHNPPSKYNLLRKQFAVLLVSSMLGIANILKNETKFIIDFKASQAIIKIEEKKPAPVFHPILLWKPKFYIKELFDTLNNKFKFN